jgi:hypothetical protein
MPLDPDTTEAFIDALYVAFDPLKPLPPSDPRYVNCDEVRGGSDVLKLAKPIKRLSSERVTCQLYTGHRGAGKSTELLRLEEDLKKKGFTVVYLTADQDDIDPQDAEYIDILLACTRRLIEAFRDSNKAQPVLDWLRERWEDLKDLTQTSISFEGLSFEQQFSAFSKLTANLKAEPSLRFKIRNQINPHSVTLVEALNQYIERIQEALAGGDRRLVLIVDNLDRIVPKMQEDGRSNHEDIFIDRGEQLTKLACHTVYTVPISLVCSQHCNRLDDIYQTCEILPMIAAKNQAGDWYEPGLKTLAALIQKRVDVTATEVSKELGKTLTPLNLEGDIFDRRETLVQLCYYSGGHARTLMRLVQRSLDEVDRLPLGAEAVRVAMTAERETLRRTVNADQWAILAEVDRTKNIENNSTYRTLVFSRCILEFRDERGQAWYDVHPLIRGLAEFKQAQKVLEPDTALNTDTKP